MKLIIHIGLPKTAVTTLSYLFENSEKLNFLGRPLTPLYDILWQSMIFDNEKIFKKKISNLKNKIYLSLSKEKKNILLIEGITDPFFTINNNIDFIKRLGLLKNILRSKVKIEIIYVIRKQPDFIVSRYVESSQFFKEYNSNWSNFEMLKRPFKKGKITAIEKKFFKKFKFYDSCNQLVNIFGRKNVNIFLFEELKYDKKNFSKKISEILNLKKKTVLKILQKHELNRSNLTKNKQYIRKNHQLNYILTNNFVYIKFNKVISREIKLFFKNLLSSLDKYLFSIIYKFYPASIIKINDNEKKLIKKFFIYDNKKIEKSFQIKLKKYNYY